MNVIPHIRQAAIVLGCVTFLAGCAGKVPKPDSQMNAARTAIEQAEAADARQYEPVLLNQATNKIVDARERIDKKEYDKATILLEQAEVDARLAEARSETKKSRDTAEEVTRSIDALEMKMKDNAQ